MIRRDLSRYEHALCDEALDLEIAEAELREAVADATGYRAYLKYSIDSVTRVAEWLARHEDDEREQALLERRYDSLNDLRGEPTRNVEASS